MRNVKKYINKTIQNKGMMIGTRRYTSGDGQGTSKSGVDRRRGG